MATLYFPLNEPLVAPFDFAITGVGVLPAGCLTPDQITALLATVVRLTVREMSLLLDDTRIGHLPVAPNVHTLSRPVAVRTGDVVAVTTNPRAVPGCAVALQIA